MIKKIQGQHRQIMYEQRTYTWWICTGMYAKHPSVIIWMVISCGIVNPVKPATNNINYSCVNQQLTVKSQFFFNTPAHADICKCKYTTP